MRPSRVATAGIPTFKGQVFWLSFRHHGLAMSDQEKGIRQHSTLEGLTHLGVGSLWSSFKTEESGDLTTVAPTASGARGGPESIWVLALSSSIQAVSPSSSALETASRLTFCQNSRLGNGDRVSSSPTGGLGLVGHQSESGKPSSAKN